MANQIPFNNRIAKEYISALYDHTIMGGLTSNQYNTEFTSEPKTGELVKIKRANTFKAYEWEQPSDTVVQSANVTTNYIAIQKMIDCTFEITTKDWTFYVDEFIKDFFEPAVAAMVQDLDTSTLLGMYLGTPSVVEGVTSVTTKADLAKLNKAAREMKIKSGEKIALVGLETEATMFSTIDNLIAADLRGDQGYAFKNANLGTAMDIQFHVSEKIDQVYESLEASTLVDGVAYVQADVAKYGEQVILAGANAGDVIAAGQILKVGNVTFAAAEKAVASSTGVIVVKTVGVTEAIVADEDVFVTKVAAGPNFLFAKDAVNTVTVVPALPKSLEFSQVLTDGATGYGMRYYIIGDYLPSGKKSDVFRMDTYFGVKVTDPRRIRRFG